MKHQAEWSFQVSIYHLAPTTQSNSGLLGKISHDNLWSNWTKSLPPSTKKTWKSPPKNPYSRWLGFSIFDDHLEAFFFPHKHHQATEKRFPNFKKKSPFWTLKLTSLTLKKRSKMSWFLQLFCGISCCPTKKNLLRIDVFFPVIPAVSTEKNHPQASSLASFQANR